MIEAIKRRPSRLGSAVRRCAVLAGLVAAFVAPPGTAQARGGFCAFGPSGYQNTPAHSLCADRVVGRFDWVNMYAQGQFQMWIKEYIVRPFGLREVVASKDIEGSFPITNDLAFYYYGLPALYDPDGLDSNRVVCAGAGNPTGRPKALPGQYFNGLAAHYYVPCDTAVSRFTGLPVVH